MKKRTKKIIAVTLSIFVVVGLAAVLAGYSLWTRPAVTEGGSLFIEEGVTYEELSRELAAQGYVGNTRRLDLFARLLRIDGNVRPGHYLLRTGMTYPQVVRMFQGGFQTPVNVTFNNIRLLPQLAGRVARQLQPDSVAFQQVIMADTTPAYYGFTPEGFIGMFIPDTYQMYWTSTPQMFLDRMKREYENFWTGERDRKREELGLTRGEVSTLASIVYEETKKTDEMPRVAGVYLNRLRIGMPLEADPTVIFAIGDFTIKRVLTVYTKVDHPYNTYRNPGIPPGPICMPPVTAIDAVLDYEHHDYLFFCAKPDFSGYHSFARNLREHNRNSQLWREALNRAGIR